MEGTCLYALTHDLNRLSEGGTLHIFERSEAPTAETSNNNINPN